MFKSFLLLSGCSRVAKSHKIVGVCKIILKLFFEPLSPLNKNLGFLISLEFGEHLFAAVASKENFSVFEIDFSCVLLLANYFE
jgi:hypothetical protein